MERLRVNDNYVSRYATLKMAVIVKKNKIK